MNFEIFGIPNFFLKFRCTWAFFGVGLKERRLCLRIKLQQYERRLLFEDDLRGKTKYDGKIPQSVIHDR